MIDVFRHPTVTQLAAALIEGCPRSEDCIVVPLQSEGSQLPLFCLAGIQLYQPLADQFTGTRPVFGVYAEARAPGPGGSGNDSMIDLLAPVYAAAIRKVQPQGPYHLVGFSFGGALAHEIAIRLLEAGESVGLLCVLDSDAPGHIRDDRRKPLATVRRWLSLRRHGGDRNHSLEAQLEQWIRNHRPRHFAGHLVFIEAVTESKESSFGWDQLAESVTVRHLDTDHLGILKAPQAQKLATIIESALKNTSQDS
jgi:thioesterase domain-containing protein